MKVFINFLMLGNAAIYTILLIEIHKFCCSCTNAIGLMRICWLLVSEVLLRLKTLTVANYFRIYIKNISKIVAVENFTGTIIHNFLQISSVKIER